MELFFYTFALLVLFQIGFYTARYMSPEAKRQRSAKRMAKKVAEARYSRML